MKHVPLRVKLVAALCLLVAVALAVTGVLATRSLRSYLLDRVDSQLSDVAATPVRGPGPRGPAPRADADDTVHGAYYIQEIYADGTPKASPRSFQFSAGSTGPRVPHWTPTQAAARGGHAVTLKSQNGDSTWRAVVVPDEQDPDNPGGTVMYALSLNDVNSTVHRLEMLEIVIGVVGLFLLGGLGYVLVRRSLHPLIEVEAT